MASNYGSYWPGFGPGGALKRDLSNLSEHPDSAKHELYLRGDGTFAEPEGGGIEWADAPATSTSTGTAGQIAYDTNYLYICIATDTWGRVALNDWA
jgi:hypothetical protein